MTQLTLELSPLVSNCDPDLLGSDTAWEHCLWLWEILQRLPVDFVFTYDCHVVEIEEGIYQARGSDPHQWQNFIWVGDDEWMLGDSDTDSTIYPRVSHSEFGFVLGELQRKEPMPAEKIKNMRRWLP